MSTMKKPDIGTKMYFVCEHLYCIPNHAGPVKEYCVCEAEVVGFFTGGYTEVQLVGDDPNGHRTPYYFKLSEIGERVFYAPEEAAGYAQTLTVRYERIWGWLGAPDIPMRRPWENLLKSRKEGTT